MPIFQALDELPGTENTVSTTGERGRQLDTAALASSIRDAILTGKLALTACMVLGIPLMPSGPLRPVAMPCCGFTVSRAGAQHLADARRCQFCKTPLAADSTFADDTAVVQTILLEDRGFGPRTFQADDVDIGKMLGAGAEGTVFSGTVKGRPVAVKKVRLPVSVTGAVMARFKQMIAITYAAGIASQYVCRLHGYCWTDTELWCVSSQLPCLAIVCLGPVLVISLTCAIGKAPIFRDNIRLYSLRNSVSFCVIGDPTRDHVFSTWCSIKLRCLDTIHPLIST